MKNLNVNWVPGTFAVVSLTIATSPQAAPLSHCAKLGATRAGAEIPATKLIVISGERELKADVKMNMP